MTTREVPEKTSEELQELTSDELKEYFKNASPDYAEVLEKDGHDHELEMTGTVVRWKAKPDDHPCHSVDLNEYCIAMATKYGPNYRNNLEYRQLYRDIGYSLFGYWEIFFWEANNEFADQWDGELFETNGFAPETTD